MKVAALAKKLSSVPGFALGYMHGGKTVYEIYSGLANLERRISVTSATLFNIGSISKQFTAAAIVMLAKRNKLKYTDTLNKFFTSFPNWGDKVSLLHLLHHTSGITDGDDGLPNGTNNKEVYRNLIKTDKPIFKPGQRHRYSNTGYVLLALVVELVSGISLPEFLKKNIFGPTKMNNTFVMSRLGTIIPNRAFGYTKIKGRFCLDEQKTFETGDGGIYSTLRDLEKWNSAIFRGTLFNRDEQLIMSKPGVLNNGGKFNYGFGLFLGAGKHRTTVYHSGSDAGFTAFMARNPENKSSMILLTNSGNLNRGSARKFGEIKKLMISMLD